MTCRWLSSKEIAAELGVTDRAVRDLFDRGEIRGAKIGRVWRCHPDDWRDYTMRVRGLSKPAEVTSLKGALS
jgi:excisionase family DNA binding protein